MMQAIIDEMQRHQNAHAARPTTKPATCSGNRRKTLRTQSYPGQSPYPIYRTDRGFRIAAWLSKMTVDNKKLDTINTFSHLTSDAVFEARNATFDEVITRIKGRLRQSRNDNLLKEAILITLQAL